MNQNRNHVITDADFYISRYYVNLTTTSLDAIQLIVINKFYQ